MNEEETSFRIGDQVRVVLTLKVIDISRDGEWLKLSHGIWVPIDEFVERIVPEANHGAPLLHEKFGKFSE